MREFEDGEGKNTRVRRQLGRLEAATSNAAAAAAHQSANESASQSLGQAASQRQRQGLDAFPVLAGASGPHHNSSCLRITLVSAGALLVDL